MDTKNDNKDVQVLKEELWTRRTMAKVTMLKQNQTTVDNLDILKEIQQILKKEDRLSWE